MILTVGCFDVLHEGHANLLRSMAEYGEPVVAVHDDRSVFQLKGRYPIQTTSLRIANLYDSGLVKVGNVYRLDSPDPTATIRWLHANRKVDRFVRADDMPDFPGRPECERLGIEIVLVPYTDGVSSTERLHESRR